MFRREEWMVIISIVLAALAGYCVVDIITSWPKKNDKVNIVSKEYLDAPATEDQLRWILSSTSVYPRLNRRIADMGKDKMFTKGEYEELRALSYQLLTDRIIAKAHKNVLP